MKHRLTRLGAAVAALGLIAGACGDDDGNDDAATSPADPPADSTVAPTDPPMETMPATDPPTESTMAELADIVDTAVAAGEFSTLVAAVQAAGLEETLRGDGPFTVFAPTDAAFAALPEGTVEALLEDPSGDLTAILTYHVVAGAVPAADVVALDGAAVETVNGATFTVNVGDDGSVTLTDGAGNEVNVVMTDVMASNGVIHVIDAVLLPAAPEGAEDAADIVDTAVAAGEFSTLVAAVQAAGLEETLRGDGPFTVFAPTDAAFAALPEGTVEALLEDPSGDLTAILTYHVVAGAVPAADVVALDGAAVETVNGATFTVNVGDDGSVTLTDGAGNEVNVVMTDVMASNGVIHVIDAVLLPG